MGLDTSCQVYITNSDEVEEKMKREEIQRAVREAVPDVFEKMYFMFPVPIIEDDPELSFPESCFKAAVAVKDSSELFVLYGSEKLVMDMAGSFLGTDKVIEESDLVDVFKEAANVIAGNIITTLSLDGSVGLDVPVAERLRDCSELLTAQGIVFNIDDAFFRVVVFTAES